MSSLKRLPIPLLLFLNDSYTDFNTGQLSYFERDKPHIGKVLLLILIKRTAELIPLKFHLPWSHDYCVSYHPFIDKSSMSVTLKYIDTCNCIISVRYLYTLIQNKEAVGPTVIALELVWTELLQLQDGITGFRIWPHRLQGGVWNHVAMCQSLGTVSKPQI